MHWLHDVIHLYIQSLDWWDCAPLLHHGILGQTVSVLTSIVSCMAVWSMETRMWCDVKRENSLSLEAVGVIDGSLPGHFVLSLLQCLCCQIDGDVSGMFLASVLHLWIERVFLKPQCVELSRPTYKTTIIWREMLLSNVENLTNCPSYERLTLEG